MPFVYFITAGSGRGPVKIGIADDPKSRLAQLQVSHWKKLRIIASFPGSAALESTLHQRLSKDRIRGEWFRRTEDTDRVMDELKAGAQPLPSGTDVLERLRAWIVRSGLTFDEFAKTADLSPSALTRMFERKGTPRLSTIFKIQSATGGDVCSYCWSASIGLGVKCGHVTAPAPASASSSAASASGDEPKPASRF